MEQGAWLQGPRFFAAADLVDLCGQTRQGDWLLLLLRSHSASRNFYFVARDTDCRLWVQLVSRAGTPRTRSASSSTSSWSTA